MALLDISDLQVIVSARDRPLHLVRGVSFSLERGEILGIVGESGCGKSTTALAVTRLLPDNVEVIGRANFDGQNLLSLSEAQMCRIRGDRISMVFQEPMTALNPLKTIGQQIAEPLRLHRRMPRRQALAEAVRKLQRVGIADAEQKVRAYPHELSGGQRQRVVIAIALACEPDLIVADEPTTALDTTVQRQILDLLVDLVDESGIALILITHNLAVVSEIADRVLIMYRGSVVESGPATETLDQPWHPYTQGLLNALPQEGAGTGRPLEPIVGTVPAIDVPIEGCPFVERCPIAMTECWQAAPELKALRPGREVACFRVEADSNVEGRPDD